MDERSRRYGDVWLDDNQMGGLMSMIKVREINPNDYDRKVKFWSESIARACEVENDPIFTIDLLKRRFRRGDQIPGSLDVVVQNMLNADELMTVDDFKARNQNWFQWGYKRVVVSFWGSAIDTKTEFVHIPSVRIQAARMLQFFRSEYAVDDDMLPEIVDSEEFLRECANIVANKRAYDLALAELVHQGEVTIGISKTGDEILKFRDGTACGPIKWTESDAGVHDMRRAMTKLEHEIKRLEQKAKKAEQEARVHIRKGDKNLAAMHLRQKKRALKEMESKDVQYQRLLDMMHQLGRTKQNKQILDAYKAGADAFKATLQRQGISPDQIDETMDSISDAMATAEEIQDAISSGVPTTSSSLDMELEVELNSILAEDRDKTESLVGGLPEVPMDEPHHATPTLSNGNDMIAQRLKRLREAAD